MYSQEIRDKMSIFPNFLGVYARDELPVKVKNNVGLIVNTDASTQQGTHWVAIFIDKENFGKYFDSFGLPPFRSEFLNFLTNNSKNFFYNDIILQCNECTTCGHYCCAYLAARFNGYTLPEFISQFSNDTIYNDLLINKYFNNLKIKIAY